MVPDGRLDRIEAILETLTRRLDGMTQTTEVIQAAQLASEKRAAELYEADARARNLIAALTESMKVLAGIVIDHKQRIENLERRPQ
jgi:hypothetical protein